MSHTSKYIFKSKLALLTKAFVGKWCIYFAVTFSLQMHREPSIKTRIIINNNNNNDYNNHNNNVNGADYLIGPFGAIL